MKRIAVLLALGVGVAAVLWAQTSIKTAGDVEANAFIGDGSQLTNVDASGTALDTRLDNAETLLLAVQDQVNALGLAKVPETGQSAVFGAGDDGTLQLGVTWPNPRFTANGDGTVTDNLTGLIWLADASCFGTKNWTDNLSSANGLFDGSTNDPLGGDCDLSDGSSLGAWRLPNVRELASLVHYGFISPVVPNTAGTGSCATVPCAFSGVVSSYYWSSSTWPGDPNGAWVVGMDDGDVSLDAKTNVRYVWPVRGGQ